MEKAQIQIEPRRRGVRREKTKSIPDFFSASSAPLRFVQLSLRTGERRQCSRRRLRMQGKSEGPRPVDNVPNASSLDARPLPSEPIKSRGRLEAVGKERDRTGAKRSGSSGRDRWWPEPGVGMETIAFAAIRFWRGWNCQRLDEGGVLHWRTKSTTCGRRPDSFRFRWGSEKAGDFQRQG